MLQLSKNVLAASRRRLARFALCIGLLAGVARRQLTFLCFAKEK